MPDPIWHQRHLLQKHGGEQTPGRGRGWAGQPSIGLAPAGGHGHSHSAHVYTSVHTHMYVYSHTDNHTCSPMCVCTQSCTQDTRGIWLTLTAQCINVRIAEPWQRECHMGFWEVTLCHLPAREPPSPQGKIEGVVAGQTFLPAAVAFPCRN